MDWKNYRDAGPNYVSLLPPFFKFPRVHPCECGGIHEDPLFPILHGVFDFSTDGALVDAWAVDFPGLKVGKIYLYSSCLTI